MASVYDQLKSAIIRKQQVVCTYHGLRREMCPHVIGDGKAGSKVLSYQFGGESSSGELPQWRCMNVSDIADVVVRDGKFHTADTHSRPQSCVKIIDAEVQY